MRSTREVLNALRRANPEKTVTEDQIRTVLRYEHITAPRTFAGRLAWDSDNIRELATQLNLALPSNLNGEIKG